MISIAAQARLEAMRERNDKLRGRRLSEAEQIENLRRAIQRICNQCGGEVEPRATCTDCGTVNRPA